MKIRNKTKNTTGIWAGLSVGTGISLAIINSNKDSGLEKGLAYIFFGFPISIGLPTLTGHLLTSRRKEIQFNGLTNQGKTGDLMNP